MYKVALYFLLLFVFAIPWEGSVYIPGLGGGASLIGPIVVFFTLAAVASGRGRLQFRPPPVFALVMTSLVIWGACSYFWSENPNGTISRALTYFQLLLMVFAMWELCRTEAAHRKLLQAYILGAYIVVGLILGNYILNPFTPNSQQLVFRYTGIPGDPNNIATHIAIGIPMAWFLVLTCKSIPLRWLYLLFIPTSLLAIGLTASRGGAVVAIVALSIIPLTYTRLNLLSRVVVFSLLCGSLIMVPVFIPPHNLERLAETGAEVTEGNVSNRSQIWQAGMAAWVQRPLTGVGLGGFSAAIAPILGFPQAPHNSFISMLVELGIVGLLLFTFLFIIVILPILRLKGTERAFYTILWTCLIIASLPLGLDYKKVTWFIFIVLATKSAYIISFRKGMPWAIGNYKGQKQLNTRI